MGHRLPLPAGILIGTLAAVGAASLGIELLGLPHLPIPSWVRWLLQILLGMMVGLRMDRNALHAGAHALLPASLLATVLIATTVAVALVAAPLTSADLVTILFAAAPGGLTEMTLMSVNFSADAVGVAAVQLVRVVLALAVIDFLIKRLGSEGESEQDEDADDDQKIGYKEGLKQFGTAAPWGVSGGVLGLLTPVPAGGIIRALIGTAAYELLTSRPVPIEKFRLGVQVLAGGVIGLEVTSALFGELATLAGAGALIIFAQMLLWLATSWLLVRLFGYDPSTSALASSPGGISGVVPAADDVGADAVVVTFIHLVRLSTIVLVVPIVVVLFSAG